MAQKKKKRKWSYSERLKRELHKEQRKCNHDFKTMVGCVLTSKCEKCGYESTDF